MNPSISLPIGTTTVSLLVSDGTKISEPSNVEITVEDTTPPVIESFTVNPDTLWPPNHKMVPIEVTITATDNCDALPTVELTSITMDEEDETNTYDPNYDDTSGDGHTLDDIQVEADGIISLRAERSGTGDGRIYTVIYSATDASGNNATAQAIVTVPHNQ